LAEVACEAGHNHSESPQHPSEAQTILKAEKCIFEQPRVKYLSLILSEGCIEMDLVKVAGVQDWPTPRNVTKVQSFIGFINFYQGFIQDFSHITNPLH